MTGSNYISTQRTGSTGTQVLPLVDIILQTYIQTLGEKTRGWTQRETQLRIRLCNTIMRVIYPAFFLVFVLVFWAAGLAHYISSGRVQKFMLGKLVDFPLKWLGGVSLVR